MNQNLEIKGGSSMKKFLVLLFVLVTALAVFAETVDWAIEDVAGKPGVHCF